VTPTLSDAKRRYLLFLVARRRNEDRLRVGPLKITNAARKQNGRGWFSAARCFKEREN
jgi:hypothetical protein